MSAAYSIRGIAIEMYNWQKYLAWTPFIIMTILLNLDSQSWPLARAAAAWAFQVSLLSMITPKNLAVSLDGICWLPRKRVCHRVGILFFTRKGWGVSFFVRLSSWNFLMLNLQLWWAAQSKMPAGQIMVILSLLWVSVKFLLVTMIAASSIKSKRCSPNLISAIEVKSELYSGSKKCPNVCLFLKDQIGVIFWHNLAI